MMENEQSDLAEWLTTSLDATADATFDQEIDRLRYAGRWDVLNSVYFVGQEENAQ
jgi:hypothetical protein